MAAFFRTKWCQSPFHRKNHRRFLPRRRSTRAVRSRPTLERTKVRRRMGHDACPPLKMTRSPAESAPHGPQLAALAEGSARSLEWLRTSAGRVAACPHTRSKYSFTGLFETSDGCRPTSNAGAFHARSAQEEHRWDTPLSAIQDTSRSACGHLQGFCRPRTGA